MLAPSLHTVNVFWALAWHHRLTASGQIGHAVGLLHWKLLSSDSGWWSWGAYLSHALSTACSTYMHMNNTSGYINCRIGSLIASSVRLFMWICMSALYQSQQNMLRQFCEFEITTRWCHYVSTETWSGSAYSRHCFCIGDRRSSFSQ